ncbi:uncharacterized protein [Diadema setosum]|uniref:uncharacterized protein n=1 Tax=Diadema setosum TaxID=31175 RepID=UPI003B3A7721
MFTFWCVEMDCDNLKAILHCKIRSARNTRILSLNGLQLQPFPCRDVTKLSNLQHLYLSDCKLSGRVPLAIGQLPQLLTLDVSMNSLTDIPGEICSLLVKLTTLDISFNKLVTLPRDIHGMKDLTELNASQNRLVSIVEELGELSSLKYLNFSDNLLRDVPGCVLCGASHRGLLLLNVAGNLLRTLPPEVGCLRALETLDVSNNCMQFLPRAARSLGQLKVFQHAGNDWLMCPPHIPGVPLDRQSSHGRCALEKLYSYIYPPL